MRGVVVLAILGTVGSGTQAAAQVTANPAFNAPYRAFANQEYGIELGQSVPWLSMAPTRT